jgi:serine/threonine protein kinase
MTSAVEHLHKNKILHSDLHGNNWVIRKNMDMVLTDFGCGKDMTEYYGECIPQHTECFHWSGHSGPEGEEPHENGPFTYKNDIH